MSILRMTTIFICCLLLMACNQEQSITPAVSEAQAVTAEPDAPEFVANLPDGELDGETLFLVCAGCHSLEADASHKVGPNLFNIAGQAAGAQSEFQYSAPLVEAGAKGLVWEQGTLMAWIMQTEGVVPGTWMLYYNTLSSAEVMRLVGYILEQRNQD